MEKKWQIMRMFSGKQQTYCTKEKKWKMSLDRWQDTFHATHEDAKAILKEVLSGFRKVNHVSNPKLYEIS